VKPEYLGSCATTNDNFTPVGARHPKYSAKNEKYQSRRAHPNPNFPPWVTETGFLNQIFGFDAKIVAETRFLGHHLDFYIQISRGGGHGVIKIVRETQILTMPCPYNV